MLPSTGYFKGINCPFYDSGSCERPYCHFRHVRKDLSASAQSDGTESGTILQKLVSAAVQKVLQQTETSAIVANNQSARIEDGVCTVNSAHSKATYNPTPIAELNKINNAEAESVEDGFEQRRRHIPVPYTPRKPTSLPIKRPIENNGSPQAFIYIPPAAKYTPGSNESALLDPYTPVGSVESTEKYLPGTEIELQEYTIKEPKTTNKHNYVPSDKSVNKKRVLEYKPTKISSKSELPAVTYQPTPKALVPCFSSDEDEPDPKKAKLSDDFNVDDLRPEFDILDQILDEETSQLSDDISINENDEKCFNENDNLENKYTPKVKESEKNTKDENKTYKKSSEKHSNKKSSHKSLDKKSEKHDEKKSEKHDDKKSERYDDKTSDKHDDKKSERHYDKNPETHDDKKSEKPDYKKSEKHDDKKSEKHDKKLSTKHQDKEVSAKIDDKKAKIKSDKKDRLESYSKSNTKPGESKKSHKSSSKNKSKTDKSKKEKHSDSKSTDNSSKSSIHKSSKSSDRPGKDHKNSTSNLSSKTTKDSSSYYDSRHEKVHKSGNHDLKRKSNSEHHKRSKKSRESHRKEKVASHNISDNMSIAEIEFDQNEENVSDISESDEESRALECMKIFEEYVPSDKPVQSIDSSHHDVNNENEFVSFPGKKRISHTADKKIKVLPKAPLKPDYKVSAAQAMAERLAKVKEYHASKNFVATSNNITTVSKPEPIKSSINFSNPTSSKIRIAHVPYASTLVNAKKGMTSTQKPKIEVPSTSSTTIQTVKKGAQRVAHIPNEKFIDRPGVLEPLASKIPANVRSTYLNMMIDECLKIYLSATDAYARAQHEELTTSKKCCTVQIYKNSAVLTVSRLRKEFQECNGVKKSGTDCSALQKVSQLNSNNINNLGSWSIESKRMLNNSGELMGAKFYNNIKKWVLTEEQLQENGFPRPHCSGEKGRAIIYGQNKQIPPKGLIRTCCRCKKDYIVDKKGFPAIKEECIYHPNNKYRVRGEAKYQCCSQDSSSDGCCVAPCHVYEYVDFDNLKGFIKTMPPDHKMDNYGVYSLDCEMCYTTHGLDLTRVTVINSDCKVVYETLIKPLHPIIDYNTRYSGITEEQMANVKTTLLEVQATLLSMFNSESILVGHSLESDFKALKLIHDTVIDTSVLFPHKMGPPYKRALRNLSSEYLKKIIQNSVDGHDSAEDATVCMELLIYKLKEDLKTR